MKAGQTPQQTALDLRRAYDALRAVCNDRGVLQRRSGEVVQEALGCNKYYAFQLNHALGEDLGLRRRWPHDLSKWELLPWHATEDDLLAVHLGRETSVALARRQRHAEEMRALSISHSWVVPGGVRPHDIWEYRPPSGLPVELKVRIVSPDRRHIEARGWRDRVWLWHAIPFHDELLPTHILVEPTPTLKEIAGHAFYLLATSKAPRLVLRHRPLPKKHR